MLQYENYLKQKTSVVFLKSWYAVCEIKNKEREGSFKCRLYLFIFLIQSLLSIGCVFAPVVFSSSVFSCRPEPSI